MRLEELRTRGIPDAVLYDPRDSSVGGTHAMFIVRGTPEDYNLPTAPQVPTIHLKAGWQSAALTAGLMLAGTALAFFRRPRRDADAHRPT
jgi:formate dehydrogenase iron-sulfur subunit